MIVVGGKIQEKRTILFALDKTYRFLNKRVRHVFIDKTRGLPSRHGSVAAHVVDDSSRVLFIGLDLQKVRMGDTRWFIPNFLGITHGDRIIRIQIYDATVLDIDRGNPVTRSCDMKGVLET